MGDLRDLLADLVAFDTVSSKSNVDCARFVEAYLKSLELDVRLDVETVDGVEKANVVAVAGPPGEGGMLVSGHLDVVPHEGQPGWTGDPLTLRTVGDRLIGRGVADMKGFVAAVVHGMGRLDLTGLKRPLVLVFTCDEEVGCAGSGRLVERLPDLLNGGPIPAYGWIGEPTDFRTMVAHKGYFQCDVTVNTPGGHSSRPDLGVNSIEVMSEVAKSLWDLSARWREEGVASGPDLFDGAGTNSLNVAFVKGGLAMNMIPEECVLRVSGRSLPGSDQQSLLKQLEDAVTDSVRPFADGRDDVSVRVDNIELTPAMASPEQSELLTVLERFSDEQFGRAPYATDAGHFAELGARCYICGPGELSQAHQPDESVREADIVRASVMFGEVCGAYLNR